MKTRISCLVLAVALCGMAQVQSGGALDSVQVQVGPNLPKHTSLPNASTEGGHGTPYHPVHYIARHPKLGCAETVVCGEVFAEGDTHNLRTSAGTTWEYGQLAGGTAAVGTYLALTNSAITPAEADTTLTSEIAANGLSRALSTPANASTTLTVPSAGTASVVGTTGATTYNYWLAACNQSICTSVSATSNQLTTANATLSTTNYNSVAFTGQLGASSYQMYRTTSGSAPSGTSSVLVGGAPACSTSTAGVVSCTWADVSNSLTSVTIPASNLTNFGKYTLTYTWTATGAQSAQAFGVFNASSSGTLIFEGTFTQVSLNTNDTIQLVETVYF